MPPNWNWIWLGHLICQTPKQLKVRWAPKKVAKEEVGKEEDNGSSGHWISTPFLLVSFY